jgi:hypothetical protein
MYLVSLGGIIHRMLNGCGYFCFVEVGCTTGRCFVPGWKPSPHPTISSPRKRMGEEMAIKLREKNAASFRFGSMRKVLKFQRVDRLVAREGS